MEPEDTKADEKNGSEDEAEPAKPTFDWLPAGSRRRGRLAERRGGAAAARPLAARDPRDA